MCTNIYKLLPFGESKTGQTFKIVRAGKMIEVYITDKFRSQRRNLSSGRANLERRADSSLRAKRMVRWLSVANGTPKTSYFFTATFADNVLDYDNGMKIWKKFVRILTKEYPNMRYVAVPEVQPRSGRWHFHAIFCDLPKKSILKKKYGKMHNSFGKEVDAWQFHFTKVWSKANGGGKIHRANIQVARSLAGVCGYLSKYLTKEVGGTVPVGRRNYYAGGRSLRRPEISSYPQDIPKKNPDFFTKFKDGLGRDVVFARYMM